MMQAVVLPTKGGPFRVASAPKPKPGPGEISIRVVAAALNPVDWKIGKFGAFLTDKSYPAVIGCDVSGIVEDTGPGSAFARGDSVMSFLKIGAPGHGSFAEYCLAHE